MFTPVTKIYLKMVILVYNYGLISYTFTMERLIEKFRRKLADTKTDFVRSAMGTIHWEARMVGIKGARGIGKTTLLLQHIKLNYQNELESVLYVSLDDLWFSEHSLLELVDSFVKIGGKHLYLDEVHKYPQWSAALKNMYDDYPEMNVVFTGSSLLEILNGRADLSRRALVHTLQGLSFREYLNMQKIVSDPDFEGFPVIALQNILEDHESLAVDINRLIKPLKYFSHYLRSGYYPFFLEGEDTYGMRLEETILMLLEVELPLLRHIDISYVIKLKQLLSIISESAPFVPNITRLSERIGINRQTLLGYLYNLEEAKLINTIYRKSRGLSVLQKPDKIFLENTNLMYLFKDFLSDKGNLRETFLCNQLKYQHKLQYAEQGDFLVNGEYVIEVGGKNKTNKQIKDLNMAYIAADDLEYGYGNKIPLWLFGFLY